MMQPDSLRSLSDVLNSNCLTSYEQRQSARISVAEKAPRHAVRELINMLGLHPNDDPVVTS